MPQRLTDRQRAIYEFVVESIEEKGFPPSLMEIARAFGLSSPAGIAEHLKAIERKGYIRRRPGISRGIEVSHLEVRRSPSSGVRVPLVGTVPGGRLRRVDEAEGHLVIDARLASGDLFAVYNESDGLRGRGILSEDIVVVEETSRPRPGDLTVVRLDGRTRWLRIAEEDGAGELASNGRVGEVLGRTIAVVRALGDAWSR